MSGKRAKGGLSRDCGDDDPSLEWQKGMKYGQEMVKAANERKREKRREERQERNKQDKHKTPKNITQERGMKTWNKDEE